MAGEAKRRRELVAALRHAQMMNRVAANDLRAGKRQVQRIVRAIVELKATRWGNVRQNEKR